MWNTWETERLGHLTCWESHGNSSASLTKAQSDLRTCPEPHELMPEDRCVHVCTQCLHGFLCVCVCSYMDAYLSKHMHIYKRYVRIRREVFKWVPENLIGPLEAGSGFTRCTEFVIVIVAFHTKQAAAWLQLSSWQRTSAFDRCPNAQSVVAARQLKGMMVGSGNPFSLPADKEVAWFPGPRPFALHSARSVSKMSPTSLRPSKATRRAPSAPRRHRRFASSASDFCCHS